LSGSCSQYTARYILLSAKGFCAYARNFLLSTNRPYSTSVAKSLHKLEWRLAKYYQSTLIMYVPRVNQLILKILSRLCPENHVLMFHWQGQRVGFLQPRHQLLGHLKSYTGPLNFCASTTLELDAKLTLSLTECDIGTTLDFTSIILEAKFTTFSRLSGQSSSRSGQSAP